MKHNWKRLGSGFFAVTLAVTLFGTAPTFSAAAAGNADSAVRVLAETTEYVQFTYSNEGITATSSTGEALESGSFEISGCNLTITDAGTYRFSGTCDNGSIKVKKGSGEVRLVLAGLNLTCQTESVNVVEVKKSNSCTLVAEAGTSNTLCVASASGVKNAVSASENLTLEGPGTLKVVNEVKDVTVGESVITGSGIKADGNLTIDKDIQLEVTAMKNGLAADNQVEIKSGKITITSGSDAIRSCPDTDEEGNLLANGDIIISGGEFNINATEDAIQADHDLTITGGTFDIKTNGGYTTKLSDNSDSCKALKAVNDLTVYGGGFNLNSADDAIHSNTNVYLLGGTYTIYTGDDGAHADTALYLGSEAGGCPGGGGFGGYGNTNNNSSDVSSLADTSTADDYSINVSGGDVYVNCEGDGFDSNGSINVTGGKMIIISAASNGSHADNSALDYETTCVVNGGTVLAMGAIGVGGVNHIVPTSGSQIYTSKSITITKGSYVNVANSSGTAVESVLLPKQIAHVVYTAPTGGSWTITSGSSASYTCTHESAEVVNKKAATKEEEGYTGDSYCKSCGSLLEQGSWIAKLSETEVGETEESTEAPESSTEESTEAPESGTGESTETPEIGDTQTATAIASVKLSKTSYVYNGKYHKPTVSVKDAQGNVISSAYYKVTYKSYKYVGTATVTVTGDGTHVTGTVKKTFKIVPAGTSISSISARSGGFLLKWKKKTTQVSGYQIRYSTYTSMKNAKTVRVTSKRTVKKTITGLKKGKKYYVQVRTYKTVKSKRYYSSWSKKKSVTTKK